MNQKLAWSTFAGGLGTFLTSLGEFFSSHNSWHDMSSPSEVGHILIMTASLVITILGALGANLPREKNTRTDDSQVSSDKLNEINNKLDDMKENNNEKS